MGVENYNCDECGEIFADCGHYGHCCSCEGRFCGYCYDHLQKFTVECDCVVCDDSDCDDPHEDEHNEGCIMDYDHPNVKKLHPKQHEAACPYECEKYHHVCKECLEVKDPYHPTADEVIEFLIKGTMYKDPHEAWKACREAKKQRMSDKEDTK